MDCACWTASCAFWVSLSNLNITFLALYPGGRPPFWVVCPATPQPLLCGLVDLDLPRPGRGLLRQLHSENPVLIIGLHAFRIDGRRHREATDERTVAALNTVVALGVLVLSNLRSPLMVRVWFSTCTPMSSILTSGKSALTISSFSVSTMST